MQPSPQPSRRTLDEPLVYERLSDPILVRRAKDGDPNALRALCERHAPRVERIALHVLRDPEDARDAAQESLVKLVRRIGQFRGQSEFSTWLRIQTCTRAVRNSSNKYYGSIPSFTCSGIFMEHTVRTSSMKRCL